MVRPEIVELLDALGFSRGCIVETIVATRNPDGSPNAAPMGITRTGPDLLEIRPFKSSRTYGNLAESHGACVNVTWNPELFFVTAFKNDALPGFTPPHVDEDLTLESADASVFVEILSSHDISKNRGCFVCRVKSVEALRPIPRVFSRGRAEAIEAVVHATRIQTFFRRGRSEDAEKLKKRFDECKGVVERVSLPGSAESRVIQALEILIERWGEEPSR